MTTVGYYEISTGTPGSSKYAAPITAIGQTAIGLDELTAQSLSGIDTLFLLNPSNDSYGAEFLQSQSAIADFVREGGHVVMFDRYVIEAGSILPGTHDLQFTRELPGTDVDFEDDYGTYALGPGGGLDDSSLDGGNESDHGYIDRSQLGSRFVVVQTTGNPDHVVSLSYEYGSGSVFYSTMPLDYYLNGGSGLPNADNFVENVLATVALTPQAGSDGADFIHVAGDGQIAPPGYADLTLATAGADYVLAGAGDDIVLGGAGTDRLEGGAGADSVRGQGGDDVLRGLQGDDELRGGHGDDVLVGDAGRDLLVGGNGADTLAGGAGSDRFVFSDAGRDQPGGWGSDLIEDFTRGEDRIDLRRASAITGFDDLTIKDRAGSALISSGGDSILLKGVDASTLTADDFVFADAPGAFHPASGHLSLEALGTGLIHLA